MKLSLEPRETGNLCRVASEPLEYWKGCWHWATEYVGLSVGPSTEISLWATAGPVCWETQCLGVAAPSNSLSKLIAKNLLCNSQLFVILKKRFFKKHFVCGSNCQKMSSLTKWGGVTKNPTFSPYIFHVSDFWTYWYLSYYFCYLIFYSDHFLHFSFFGLKSTSVLLLSFKSRQWYYPVMLWL